MTAKEAAHEIISKIAPQLNELGVEAFAFAAYVNDGDGKIQRIFIGNGGGNPAYLDGLRPLIVMGSVWEQGKA